jgi:hypothetical protein
VFACNAPPWFLGSVPARKGGGRGLPAMPLPGSLVLYLQEKEEEEEGGGCDAPPLLCS